MTLRAHLRRLPRDRRGAAMIEFVMVAPLLISLVCGAAEFGWAFRQYHVMQKGVRDAGRYLSRVNGACPTGAQSAAWTSAVTTAKQLALYGKAGGSTPLHKGWSSVATLTVGVTCVDNTSSTWRGAATMPVVTVTAEAAYDDMGLLSVLGLTAPTLKVAHQELVVGS